jgi:hypothetical protein
MGRHAGRRSGNIQETTEIRIVEAYHDYCPPFDLAKVVRRLLRAVPDKYLRDLDCVVLRNESALTRKESAGKVWSRKRKIDKTRMLGCYHPRWQHKEPWIEIRVDKTIAAWRGPRYFPATKKK